MYSYIVHKYIYVYILMFVCMCFLEGLAMKKRKISRNSQNGKQSFPILFFFFNFYSIFICQFLKC